MTHEKIHRCLRLNNESSEGKNIRKSEFSPLKCSRGDGKTKNLSDTWNFIYTIWSTASKIQGI